MNTSKSPNPYIFFLLTFLFSWGIWIPLVLSHFDIGPFHVAEDTSMIVRLLGVLMPAFAAILLTGLAGGRKAISTLLGRLGIWQVSWRWWVAAALGQPILLLISGLVFNAIGGTPAVAFASQADLVAVIINIVILLVATLGEEIGWRGLALPTLQTRNSSLWASIILGVFWAVWHLPFWLLLDSFDQFGFGYLVMNFLWVFPLTIYITWFTNRSRNSLLLPVIFHLSFNIINTIWLPVTINPGAYAIFIALEWVVALLIIPRLETKQLKLVTALP